MRTLREKVFDDIAACISEAGYEPVQDMVYANIGNIRIQSRTSLTEYGRVGYEFQGPTIKLSVRMGSERIALAQGRDEYTLHVDLAERGAYVYFRSVLVEELTEMATQEGGTRDAA